MLVKTGQGMAAGSGLLTSPAQIPGLSLWLDAQDLSTLTFASGSGNGDPVSTWGTKKGTFDLDRENASHSFIYKSIGLHGKPALRMEDNRAVMRDAGFGTPSKYGAQVTLITFFGALPIRTPTNGVMAGFVSSTALMFVTDDNTFKYINNQGGSAETATGTYDLTAMTMAAISFESASSANMKINNLPLQNFDPNNSYDDNGALRIGAQNPTTDSCQCEYYGVLMFDRALTDLELQKIYQWGAAKYGRVSERSMFLMAGQSNMAGFRPTGDSGVPAVYNYNSRVEMLNTDQVLRPASDPVDLDTGAFSGLMDDTGEGFGAQLVFGDNLAEDIARNIGLVPVAKAGTRIAQWARNASDPDDTTTYYGALLTQAREAQKYGTLKSLIWYQGESDAADGTAEATYETALTNLITNLRSDLGISDLYVIVTKLHQWDAAIAATQTNWNNIQDAQEDVATTMSNVGLVDASDLAGETGDEIHLSVASYKTLGARWSDHVQTNLTF